MEAYFKDFIHKKQLSGDVSCSLSLVIKTPSNAHHLSHSRD